MTTPNTNQAPTAPAKHTEAKAASAIKTPPPAAHSPLPWKLCGGYTPKCTAIISPGGYIVFGMADYQEDKEDGDPIRFPDYEKQRENAAYIVQACNAYPALVEALEDAFVALGRLGGNMTDGRCRKEWLSARSALDQAKKAGRV